MNLTTHNHTPSRNTTRTTNLMALLLMGSVTVCHGQNAASGATPLMLEEVIVSGTRQARFTDDLPLSTDVVTTREIEFGQMGDILDLAKTLPNISVKRAPARFSITGRGNPVGADGNAGFSIRGQGGNRVLMLVDGIRQPRSYQNGSNAFGRDSIALGLVKQVEIVRGPASALYGSDGLAGLVNFITLTPQDLLGLVHDTPAALGGRAWASHSGDDEGSTLGAALAGRSSDTTQWLLSANSTRASGMHNMGSNDAANVDRTTPNPQSTHDDALLAKLVWQANPEQQHQFTLEHITKSDDVELLSSRAKPPFTGTVAAQNALIRAESSSKTMQRDRLSWQGNYHLDSDLADRIQANVSWQDSNTQEDGQTVRNDSGVRLRKTSYQERGWQASLQGDKLVPMSSQWSQSLSFGVDYAATDVASLTDGSDPLPLPAFTARRYFPDSRDSQQALFLQSEWVSDNWSLTPGVRIDHYAIKVLNQSLYYPGLAKAPAQSLSGSATSPKIAVLYRVTPQWSVYGQVASGFRAPESQQVNSTLEVSTAKLLPNPDLKPEESQNFELGLKARLSQWRMDLAFFNGRYSNLIQEKKNLGTANGLAASTTNPTLFQTVNIDKASLRGFEFKAHRELGVVAGGKLAASAAYGQTRGTNDSTGQPLSYLDPAKLSVGLAYTSATWDVSLTVNHSAGKQSSELDSPYIPKSSTQLQFTPPSATTVDLNSQWRLRKNLRLHASVINLTDQKYWNWSDVQGLASNPTAPLVSVVDAYSQPGRHINLSLVMDF